MIDKTILHNCHAEFISASVLSKLMDPETCLSTTPDGSDRRRLVEQQAGKFRMTGRGLK
jgi:hypothetical protein